MDPKQKLICDKKTRTIKHNFNCGPSLNLIFEGTWGFWSLGGGASLFLIGNLGVVETRIHDIKPEKCPVHQSS